MPFFYKIHSEKYKVEKSHLMLSDFLKIFKFNTWTSKIGWSANCNLENLRFLGRELSFPWHFNKFYSNFLRYPFLSSLGWRSHVLEMFWIPFVPHPLQLRASSFQELRSNQVVIPAARDIKGPAAFWQRTTLGNISLVFVIFAATLNFLSEVMNEQITSVIIRIGQSVECSFNPNFRKYSWFKSCYFFPMLILTYLSGISMLRNACFVLSNTFYLSQKIKQ